MLWAAVPEAAIHKNGKILFGKYEVGFAENI